MEFQQQMYQDYPEAERRQIMNDSCDVVEDHFHFTRPLSEREIVNRKDVLAQKSIELNDIEREKKDAMAAFEARMKPLRIDIAIVRDEIKTRHVEATEQAYVFHDQLSGYALYYDQRGNQVMRRLLTPKEMQTTTMRAIHNANMQNPGLAAGE